MRRYALVITSTIALMAFLGISAPAFALHDPGCDKWGNDQAIHDFTVSTPDSDIEHQVSSVVGSGYACGSEIENGGVGIDTLYNHADIGVPPGVEIADSDSVPVNSFTGTATTNVLYFLDIFGVLVAQRALDVPSWTQTANKARCESERDTQVVPPTPQGEIIACYHGWNILGENWNWATLVDNGATQKLWLTIGPMHALGDTVRPGLTKIGLNLCAYFGPVLPLQCGTGGQWMQKNGDASYIPGYQKCDPPHGEGIYTVTATTQGDPDAQPPIEPRTTDSVEACVMWHTAPVGPRHINPRHIGPRHIDVP